MKLSIDWLRRRWRDSPGPLRIALIALLIMASAVALIRLWMWQHSAQARLSLDRALAAAQVVQMQNDIVEVERLRAQALPTSLSGQALYDVVATSLRGRNLNLQLEALGTDSLRIQGTADFDAAMLWLGTMARDHRLRVRSLSIEGRESGAKIEAVLGSVRP